jgi:hypothetical protein
MDIAMGTAGIISGIIVGMKIIKHYHHEKVSE